jgi:hypothetical protein
MAEPVDNMCELENGFGLPQDKILGKAGAQLEPR